MRNAHHARTASAAAGRIMAAQIAARRREEESTLRAQLPAYLREVEMCIDSAIDVGLTACIFSTIAIGQLMVEYCGDLIRQRLIDAGYSVGQWRHHYQDGAFWSTLNICW